MTAVSATDVTVASSLRETLQKVQAALQPAIQQFAQGQSTAEPRFDPSRDSFDFLSVKNSLVVTYLIEYVYRLRQQLLINQRGLDHRLPDDDSNLSRLTEIRITLDKIRGLDKKLRYQIDKLLAAGSHAGSYAVPNAAAPEDPLQFRPELQDDDSDLGSETGRKSGRHVLNHESDGSAVADDDDVSDADLAAARATVNQVRNTDSDRRSKVSGKSDRDEEREVPDGELYRVPRMTAVPYFRNVDREAVEARRAQERESRLRDRQRASEIAQTLRSQYGEAPEQDDVFGGGMELGNHRAAARKLSQKQEEKTRYEEEAMVRLVTTRAEKKEKKQLMRAEQSNLVAISDLGNLVREAATITNDFSRRKSTGDARHAPRDGDSRRNSTDSGRYQNGKRKKQQEGAESRPSKGRKSSTGTRNTFEAALFGREGDSGRKKPKKTRK
jgi:U3 small nucleolar ribonucleoprotein protein LCP5